MKAKPQKPIPCPHCGIRQPEGSQSKNCAGCGMRMTEFMTAEEAAVMLSRSACAIYHGEAGTECLSKIRPNRRETAHGRVLLVYSQVLRHSRLEITRGTCDGSCASALSEHEVKTDLRIVKTG
ncbi:MAG: hypothetical protein WBV94_03960 [Blastocatellia bacterium]